MLTNYSLSEDKFNSEKESNAKQSVLKFLVVILGDDHSHLRASALVEGNGGIQCTAYEF